MSDLFQIYSINLKWIKWFCYYLFSFQRDPVVNFFCDIIDWIVLPSYLLMRWNISRVFGLILDGAVKNRCRKSQHSLIMSGRTLCYVYRLRKCLHMWAWRQSHAIYHQVAWHNTCHGLLLSRDKYTSFQPRAWLRVSYRARQRLHRVRSCLDWFEIEHLQNSRHWQ